MRLLYLIDELRARGGTERHLWELSHGLASRGHQVTVLSLDDGPPFGGAFQSSSQIRYECLRINRVYGPSGWAGFARLTALIRHLRPHVVQTFHAGSDLIGPLAARLAWNPALRISSRRDLGYTKSDRIVRVQSRVNCLVHLVLANSQEVAHCAMARETIPPEKVRLIYNGIDAAPFAAIERRLLPDAPVLATVANLRPVKGVHVLLKAMHRLADQHPSLTLRIAGGGPERDRLESLAAEYGLADRVSFVGSIENVAEFLANVDIYVQPSLEEGFSNSVLEAMASALPVVATGVGGNQDIIKSREDGVLVPPGDDQVLAAAIMDLAGSAALCATLGQAARRKVLASFTLPRMLDQYEKLYAAGADQLNSPDAALR